MYKCLFPTLKHRNNHEKKKAIIVFSIIIKQYYSVFMTVKIKQIKILSSWDKVYHTDSEEYLV